MITTNPLKNIYKQAKQTKKKTCKNYIVTEKDKNITGNHWWLKDNEIWQHWSQNQSDCKTFFVFFSVFFFLKKTKGLKWDSFWTCNADSFELSCAMTSTTIHPFTVQFVNSCIDLRAFSEQNLFELAHPQGISYRDCAAKINKEKWSKHIRINLMTMGLSQLQQIITKQKREKKIKNHLLTWVENPIFEHQCFTIQEITSFYLLFLINYFICSFS